MIVDNSICRVIHNGGSLGYRIVAKCRNGNDLRPLCRKSLIDKGLRLQEAGEGLNLTQKSRF